MSKFRYLIERGTPKTEVEYDSERKLQVVEADLYITTITPGDDTGTSFGTAFTTVEAAQARAEELHQHDGSEDADTTPLRWKDPPQAWQPDALCVSQYLDDGVEENRDA
jgi:hypothetical protein